MDFLRRLFRACEKNRHRTTWGRFFHARCALRLFLAFARLRLAACPRWLCLAPLLAGCATVGPLPTVTPPDETVALRFDWEPGSTARVHATRSITGWTARGVETQRVALRYELAAEEGADGSLDVNRKEVKIDAMPTIWDPQSVEMVAMELAQPDLRIGPHGNLSGIEQQARAHATAASLLGRLAKSGSVSASFEGRFLELFGDEAMRERAASSWDDLVGYWSGGDLEVGRTYEARDRVTIDGLGGIGLEMIFEATLVGRVPCVDGDVTARCVRLELVARPEPDQRRRLLAFVATLFPEHAATAVEIEDRITLITEPDDLRPHRLQMRRSVVIPFASDPSGTPPRFEQLEERVVSFAWTQSAEAP